MDSGSFLVSINNLLWFARSEFFGMGVALALVLWAVVSSVKMINASGRAKTDTKLALDSIRDVDNSSQFTNYFAEIDEKLLENSRFQTTWIEFKKTLIPPLEHIAEPEYKAYRATKRPHDYFDSAHVLRDIRPFIFESENLIGIGLFFTFLGLIAALIHAGLNLTAANSDGVQRVIQELLSTAGAKFFASLGGVAGALIQAIAKRAFSDSAEAELEGFLSKLESLLPFASLEKIASEQYSHAIRQTARLEEMGSEITMAIGARIESAIKSVGTSNEGALRSLPTLLGPAMKAALGDTETGIKKLDGSLKKSSDEMPALLKVALSGALIETNEKLTSTNEKLTSANEKLTSTDEKLTSTNEKLTSANEKLTSTDEKLTSTNEKLESLNKGIGSTSTDAIRELVGQFREQLTGAGEQTMQKVVDQLDALSSTLNQTVGSLAQSNLEIRATMSEMLEALKSSRTEFGDSIANSADAAAKQMTEVTQGVTLALNEVLIKLDNQHKETSVALSQLVKTFSDAGDDAAKKMRQSSEHTSSEISESLQKAISAVLESAKDAGTDMSKKVAEGFDAASTEMSNRANEALKISTDTIIASMTQVAKSLELWNQATLGATGAMGQVNQALGAHRQGVEQVNAKLRDTEAAIGATTSSLREATGPLASTATQLSAASEALKRAVADAMTRINEVGAITKNSASEIAIAIRGLADAWKEQSSHLKLSNDQIERAFKSVTQNLEQSLGVLEKFTAALADSLGNSLRDLGTIAAELVDAVEGMKK